jgi:hypothetical protein
MLVAVALAQSGLYGQVRIDPAVPVCSIDAPCWKPAAGAVVAFTRHAHTYRAKANTRGYYRIGLRAGTYVVRVERPRAVGAPRRFTVTVPQDRYRRLNIAVDIGIR